MALSPALLVGIGNILTPGSGGGGGARVIRALGNGQRTTITQIAGLSTRAATHRHSLHSVGNIYRSKVRLQLFYHPSTQAGSVLSPFVDTLLPNPLDFQFACADTYVNDIVGLPVRKAWTWGGALKYAYPGASAFAAARPGVMHIDSDWIDHPAGTKLLDIHETVEVPAGQTPNNSLPITKAVSNRMPRSVAGNFGLTTSTASHIDAGFALNSGVGASPALPITLAPATPEGNPLGFTFAMLIIETDAGVKTMLLHGPSHTEGANIGTQYDTYKGVTYGDASGDELGLRGMFDRKAWDAGFNSLNIGRGGQWEGNMAVAANTVGTRAMTEDLVWDKIWNGHSFNDLNKTRYSGTYPAAGTPVEIGWVYRGGNSASGNVYMVTKAGTTAIGANGVTGTGSNIPDGTAELKYIGPNVSATVNTAYGAYGNAYAMHVYLKTAFPGVPVTRTMPIPNPAVVNVALTSLTASGTTVTAVSTAAHNFSTGSLIAISGASPAAYNGTFAVTVVDATTYTYTAASAPGSAATGTLVASDLYQSQANQLADTAQGAGTGTASRRGLYYDLIVAGKAELGYVNYTDPSAIIESDHASLNGKVISEAGYPSKIMTGAHLTAYGQKIAGDGAAYQSILLAAA